MPEFELVFNRLDTLSYIGIFFVFIIPFLPIPEEVLLLGIGYLASLGDWNVYWAIVASAAGIAISDNLWFWLGKTHSKFALKLRRRIGEEKNRCVREVVEKSYLEICFSFPAYTRREGGGTGLCRMGKYKHKKVLVL